MRTVLRLAVVMALAAGAAGCKKAPARADAAPARYYVLKDGKRAQWIEDSPGALGSQAAPPPDGRPARGYLTAVSLNAFEEGNLRGFYEKAKSFDEYVALLKKNGYGLEPAPEAP
jgi:hypothetical protein